MNLDHENEIKKQWGVQTLREIRSEYASMVKGRSGDGLKSLTLRTGKSFGGINRLSFGLARYLVWVHKGAGKGKGGDKGSSWFHKGLRVKTNPSSRGKMNTGSRRKKEFFNPVIDAQVPKLADLVVEFQSDRIVKAIKIK